MKKSFVFLLIPLIVLSFASCGILELLNKSDWFYKIEDVKLEIENYKYNYANDQQTTDTTKLFMNGSKLYVYNRDSGDIHRITADGTAKVLEIPEAYDCVVIGDEVYYPDPEDSGVKLYRYNFSTQKRECVYDAGDYVALTIKENVLYVENSEMYTYSITDGVVSSEPISTATRFVEAFGKRYEYRTSSTDNDIVIVVGEEEKVVSEIEPFMSKVLVATDNGVVVHNEDSQKLLYFIDGETDQVTELFSVECMASETSMTVHGDDVYLSVYRYEKMGPLGKGMVGYENDEISGTYRINLKTGKATKISDGIYAAMYVFDSTGIYAVEENGKTYKLDFDGNVIQTIVS